MDELIGGGTSERFACCLCAEGWNDGLVISTALLSTFVPVVYNSARLGRVNTISLHHSLREPQPTDANAPLTRRLNRRTRIVNV